MSFIEFLKDKFIVYIIYGISLFLIIVFLSAFHVPVPEIIIVSVMLFISFITVQLWDFFRRKNYYDRLLMYINSLDKKYLISEMQSMPNFYDGKILYEVLYESNKSMYEHIKEHIQENIEFQEFIELWVHEIKIPVSRLQLMCHNEGNTQYSMQLQYIDDYIENVLYYVRSRNAEKDYIFKEISLRRVFADVALKNREEIQLRGVKIKTENLDVCVVSDSKWLFFIINQLMGNSMKYFSAEREPEIKIFADENSDRIILHFRDNGIGIPSSDLPYIFEKSFTGENGRICAKSTGMGLYIVKNLCTKLGHDISAESVQGEYTEIIISFGKNDFHKMQ